jgi:hypothetical protein
MAQEALVLESIWSKEDVVKAKTFKDRILKEDWQPLLTRHQFGMWLLEKKKQVRHGKFTTQLQILGEQIGYSFDSMRRCMRFAKMFPDFMKFQLNYPDEPPAWRQIVRDLLYDAENENPSESRESSRESYERWVLNWTLVNSERRAWLYRNAPQVVQKNHHTKSEALEEGLFLYCEKYGCKPPASLEEKFMPGWIY